MSATVRETYTTGKTTVHVLTDGRSVIETALPGVVVLSDRKRNPIAKYPTLDEALAAAALDGSMGLGGHTAPGWLPTDRDKAVAR